MTTNEVLLDQTLDYETSVYHTVVIQAVDNGYPRKSASNTFRIDVTDANDRPHNVRLTNLIIDEYVDPLYGKSMTKEGSVISEIVVHDQDRPRSERFKVEAEVLNAQFNWICVTVVNTTDPGGNCDVLYFFFLLLLCAISSKYGS